MVIHGIIRHLLLSYLYDLVYTTAFSTRVVFFPHYDRRNEAINWPGMYLIKKIISYIRKI